MLDIGVLSRVFLMGAVGYLAASILSSIALVPAYLAIPALAVYVQVLFVGPAAEEFVRATILKKRQDLWQTPTTLLLFSLGWFLVEIIHKLLNGVDLRVSRFCGLDYVGSFQPLFLHALYTYLSWTVLRRSKNVILAISATLSVHMMYNISVLVSDALGMKSIEIDDLFTIVAFATCLFLGIEQKRKTSSQA